MEEQCLQLATALHKAANTFILKSMSAKSHYKGQWNYRNVLRNYTIMSVWLQRNIGNTYQREKDYLPEELEIRTMHCWSIVLRSTNTCLLAYCVSQVRRVQVKDHLSRHFILNHKKNLNASFSFSVVTRPKTIYTYTHESLWIGSTWTDFIQSIEKACQE